MAATSGDLPSGDMDIDMDTTPRDTTSPSNHFPFLQLPLEIRLAIYAYVLPARTHTIVTQYPHNGYYYSKPPSHTSQTLYPAWSASPHSPPSHNTSTAHILTTYKLLNANFRPDFPSPSIATAVLRASRQLRQEAEPILYSRALFDFGVYVDAVVPFLQDRSAVARACIRSLKLAREIPGGVGVVVPASDLRESADGERQELKTPQDRERDRETLDPLWSKTCDFLKAECGGLRTVDLTVWAESGNMVELPVEPANPPPPTERPPTSGAGADADADAERPVLVDDGHLWREWEWTRKLLLCEGLRHVKVTWWGFSMDKVGQGRFDSWLGRRMVADKLVRDRMVWEGCVVEGVCVVPGGWKASNELGG